MRGCNREILNILHNNKVKDIDKILRVEQNLTDYAHLRHAIGKSSLNTKLIHGSTPEINSVRLGEMVSSKKKPLLERHRTIMQFANQVDLFSKYDNWSEAVFCFGIEGLYKACNGSLELLLDFCRQTSSKRNYYRLKSKIQSHFSNNIMRLVPNLALEDGKNPYLDSLNCIENMLLTA